MYVKINEDQFLEKAELNRLITSLKESGYLKLFNFLTNQAGVITDGGTSLGDSFLVEATSATEIKINTGFAIDVNNLIIELATDHTETIPINASNRIWVKISHEYTNLEDGTVTVDSQGNITGVGTAFTDVLRGQPNFPSKVVIYDISTSSYSGEFDVLRVISDTSVILQGDIPAGGYAAGSQYSVIGTFTHDATPTTLSKNIFQYDSCDLEFLTTVTDGIPILTTDEEFLIAKITNYTGTIVITDLRDDYSFQLKSVLDTTNFALINRENIFEKLYGISSQTLTSSRPANISDLNTILTGATASFLNTNFVSFGTAAITGFLKAEDTPFEAGSILYIKKTSSFTQGFSAPTTINGILTGFEDYADWLYTGTSQVTFRRFYENEVIKVMCVANTWDSVTSSYKSLWRILASLKSDTKYLNDKIVDLETDISGVGTVVFVSGIGGINSTSDADTIAVPPAKEGDIFIS